MDIKRVLVPIPSYGFDPTEVAIPWQLMSDAGIEVIFSTPDGHRALADTLMLHGKGLGLWKPVLKARKDAVIAYEAMEQSPSFQHPRRFCELDEENFDGLLLPGGHDKGVKEYLESGLLQNIIVRFFRVAKPVAAICHGVVLAARSIDPGTGKSVLYDYKTTALLKKQELLAFSLTRLWLKDYYLTYPECTVEDEVRSVLSNSHNFLSGPSPTMRDNLHKLHRGFVVQDRNYISARWPGDAYKFSLRFIRMLNNTDGAQDDQALSKNYF